LVEAFLPSERKYSTGVETWQSPTSVEATFAGFIVPKNVSAAPRLFPLPHVHALASSCAALEPSPLRRSEFAHSSEQLKPILGTLGTQRRLWTDVCLSNWSINPTRYHSIIGLTARSAARSSTAHDARARSPTDSSWHLDHFDASVCDDADNTTAHPLSGASCVTQMPPTHVLTFDYSV